MKFRAFAAAALAASTVFVLGASAAAETFLVDLTHPMGTFAPLDGDISKADLNAPRLDSIAVPSFGPQTVYDFNLDFTTNQGRFQLGRVVLTEHHGTHMDSSRHYVNTPETTETDGSRRKYMHQMTAEDLIGRAVVIDIGSRVQAELDKNGGKPSPDVSVIDFSNDSGNVVTADDIDAVAGEIADRVWIVVNLGWSRFFYDANWDTTPYFNGWNFPGLNKAAIDKLIEIEDAKGIHINGIVIDNIGIDTGESSLGTDDKWSNSFYSHVRGLQRGWKFVENATNLGQVALADAGSCTIVVGAPKHVQGGGGPSRVFAMCER